MIYVKEYIHDPSYFEPWSGAVNRWHELDGYAKDLVYEFLEVWSEEMAKIDDPLTATDINDWIWFDCEEWLANEHGLNLDGTPIESE